MSGEREKYLIEAVIPSALKLGRFGAGMKFVRFEKDENDKAGIQFASSVVFLTAVVNEVAGGGEAKEHKFRLVIKFLPDSLKVREMMNSTVQFYNENTMYSDILPFLDHNNIVSTLFPKFYYGETSDADGKQPVVVVEDLRDKGFKTSKFKVVLDYNHITVALKGLGKFHSLSYIAKQKNPTEFNKIRSKLKEHAWDRDYIPLADMIGPCCLRGINAFYSGKKSDTLNRLIEKLKNDTLKLVKYLIEPEEPVAVICHGDFCNHNVFFKYDSSDVPVDVKFFDLQTSRYASPVIDLSMLLYLNTDYDVRSRYWDDFLSVYYNTVFDTVSDAGCIPPTFEQLVKEFQNKSFYGYINCSYFLPMMISDGPPPDINDTCDLSPEEINEMMLKEGGEEGTKALSEIVRHLDEYDYFGFLNR